MLQGRLARRGYDWWWHSLVAEHARTGEKKPFFFEYFMINPAVSPSTVVFGEQGQNRPAYAMIKGGTWGKDAAQLHRFYPTEEACIHPSRLEFSVGPQSCSEFSLRGEIEVRPQDLKKHPEWMCESGSLSWDLTVDKKLCYNVGYGASPLARILHAFEMYWHVQGMLSEYSGKISWNGEEYIVRPGSSSGYQDKNWGADFTNPWIWLNCNTLRYKGSSGLLQNSSLDVGGGRPRVFGHGLDQKILVAFFLEGKLYEFNFSRFWIRNQQSFHCRRDDKNMYWDIDVSNARHRLKLEFFCPLDTMLKVNYENPDGYKHHTELWNGGLARGEISLFEKCKQGWQLIAELEGEYGGCEYGEF